MARNLEAIAVVCTLEETPKAVASTTSALAANAVHRVTLLVERAYPGR